MRGNIPTLSIFIRPQYNVSFYVFNVDVYQTTQMSNIYPWNKKNVNNKRFELFYIKTLHNIKTLSQNIASIKPQSLSIFAIHQLSNTLIWRNPFANVIPQSLGGTVKVRTNTERRKKEHKSHGQSKKKSASRIFRSVPSSAHKTAGHQNTRRTWSILFREVKKDVDAAEGK